VRRGRSYFFWIVPMKEGRKGENLPRPRRGREVRARAGGKKDLRRTEEEEGK